jgi:prepilin-type processing-associated H-X9-DG protein
MATGDMNPARTNRCQAFSVPELLIVVFCLALAAALLLPGLARSRARSSRITCVNHLKQIGLSFRTFALDDNDKFPMQVSVTNGGALESIPLGWVYPHFQVMSNELSTPRILVCPQDRRRTNAVSFGPGFGDHNISYFVGIDAVDTTPQMILAGDDNLMMSGKPAKPGLLDLWTNAPIAWSASRHVNQGNLCFADGSVQQASNVRLPLFLQSTGQATNRLLMP